MVYYFIAINIISLILMCLDKKLAIDEKLRINNTNLYLLSLLGGFIGIYLGMILFNHKTRKVGYYFIVLVSLIIWLAIFLKDILKVV